jgi:hypothetical protein
MRFLSFSRIVSLEVQAAEGVAHVRDRTKQCVIGGVLYQYNTYRLHAILKLLEDRIIGSAGSRGRGARA